MLCCEWQSLFLSAASLLTTTVDVLNSVSVNLMAAGSTISHKLLNFEDGGIAMKHLYIKTNSLAKTC